MNQKYKNYAGGFLSLFTAGAILLSATSCGMIEMRDSVVETEQVEDTAPMMLEPAERKNTVETRAEIKSETVTEAEPEKVVSFVLTGDLCIDESIIGDAANRASDGKSYSFIRMYTGVFRQLSEADIAFGSYSAADTAVGSENKTPIESLAVLADVGYDVLNTSMAANDENSLTEYGILDIDDELDSNSAIRLIEREDITFAFMAVGADTVQDYEAESTFDNIAYADFASDMVIVSVNWEDDLSDADKKKIASNLAESGADVIIGDGDVLGAVEWIKRSDGSLALAAYSLGNLLATSDNANELCGGLLEFSVSAHEGVIKIQNVVLNPTVVRYTEGGHDYQIILLKDYSTDLSADHAVSGVNYDSLIPRVRETVAAEFLDPKLRG